MTTTTKTHSKSKEKEKTPYGLYAFMALMMAFTVYLIFFTEIEQSDYRDLQRYFGDPIVKEEAKRIMDEDGYINKWEYDRMIGDFEKRRATAEKEDTMQNFNKALDKK